MRRKIVPILFFAMILFFSYFDLQRVNSSVKPWMNTVITPYEMEAIEWVLKNTKKRETFLTCIFEGEFLMGMTLREATEGGDWAIVPDVTQRMYEIDEFFKTTNATRAYEISKKYGARYVWLPLKHQTFCGYGWFSPDKTKFSDSRFIERYKNEGVVIYEVS